MKKKLLCGTCLALVASLALASGCAKKTVKSEETAATTPPVAAPMPSDRGVGTDESLSGNPYEMGKYKISEGRTSAPLLPVYFDFDRSTIRDDQQNRMVGNADYMKSNTSSVVRIEGNCDERGTNEYNMALGERRAMATMKYMVNLGIDASRLKTISYGEERPINMGHDEMSWSQNRRADFVILQ
ncbi:MAG: peptidoglycan-associated lipoprotein Pal [Thermodesulfobacteriota bacterium]